MLEHVLRKHIRFIAAMRSPADNWVQVDTPKGERVTCNKKEPRVVAEVL
jgi:hypothetical protein